MNSIFLCRVKWKVGFSSRNYLHSYIESRGCGKLRNREFENFKNCIVRKGKRIADNTVPRRIDLLWFIGKIAINLRNELLLIKRIKKLAYESQKIEFSKKKNSFNGKKKYNYILVKAFLQSEYNEKVCLQLHGNWENFLIIF